MRNLLALLLLLPFISLAQIPVNVPIDGLVTWLPCNNSLDDETGNYTVENAVFEGFSTNAFGHEMGAISLDGDAQIVGYSGTESFNDAFSITLWFKVDSGEHGPMVHVGLDNGVNLISGFSIGIGSQLTLNDPGNQLLGAFSGVGFFGAGVTVQLEEWQHAAITWDASFMRFYLDGALIGQTAISSNFFSPSNHLFLGATAETLPNWAHHFGGEMDNIGVWNRALTEAEITAIYNEEPLVMGCTDFSACNYNPEANSDNGTCVSCEILATACGEGTIWDSTLQECIGVIPPADSVLVPIPSCGEGTVWDPVNEECIIAIPADLNYDGCVTVGDLLELLAVHGTCPPYPEWPVEPTETNWACGAPVTYWDYDYATVLIGDQCWFAENLRTTTYLNGDVIPAGLMDGEWTSTTSGATAVYGEGSSDCYNVSPDIDACDEAQSLAEYGRLYNWYAVDDARGLCPSGWHVPTDGEWTDLENHISSQGFSGSEGTALKSTYGWYNSGNGTDDFGFSALPGGSRDDYYGNFGTAGYYGYWWSSSPSGGDAWFRYLYFDNPEISRYSNNPRLGFSVRCLRDAD